MFLKYLGTCIGMKGVNYRLNKLRSPEGDQLDQTISFAESLAEGVDTIMLYRDTKGRWSKQWRETLAVLLLISFVASHSKIVQPVLVGTPGMSLVKCRSAVTAQRLHFRDRVNVTVIAAWFQEKPLESLLQQDCYEAIRMQECDTIAILIKVYGNWEQHIIMWNYCESCSQSRFGETETPSKDDADVFEEKAVQSPKGKLM